MIPLIVMALWTTGITASVFEGREGYNEAVASTTFFYVTLTAIYALTSDGHWLATVVSSALCMLIAVYVGFCAGLLVDAKRTRVN